MDIQDDKLREIFSGTKIKADENLKFRIMQQIETENALSRKHMPQTRPILRGMVSLFGVMYLIIGILAFVFYLAMGTRALTSVNFYVPVLLVSVICGFYWMITCLDDRRRSKRQK